MNKDKNSGVFVRESPATPLMIILCGLPGSGKTAYANTIKIKKTPESIFCSYPNVHSSDMIRLELHGDQSVQSDTDKVFNLLHSRIKNDLRKGKDVVYDATNIKSKYRVNFLNTINDIKCQKICIVFVTEYAECLQSNRNRKTRVPDEVINRMYMNYTPPHYGEGFDKIIYKFRYFNSPDCIGEGQSKSEFYNLDKFFEIANKFDQENSHHSLTLGEHCTKCGEYIQKVAPDNFNLLIAALLHDVGKLYTKTKTNAKGVEDGECHYYNHNCCGAYESMFYLDNAGFTNEDICYISTLIYYHMHPYLAWKQSEKSRKRDMNLLGKWYSDVLILHSADEFAH